MCMRFLLAALFTLTALLVAAPSTVNAQVTAIRFGRLIDGKGKVIKDAVVIVEGERITKVESGNSAVPPDSTVIDLRPYTGIPGLIDAHTHMTFYWDRAPGTRPWSQLGTLGSAVTVFLAQENALKALETG